ncbi:MAG TPA: ribonuclease III domain-containing protein [Limnochordales bacterium]
MREERQERRVGRWLAALHDRLPDRGQRGAAAQAGAAARGEAPAKDRVGDMRRPLPPPLHLAYLGDAVWELHVRTQLVASGVDRLSDIHRRAVDQVRAAAQAGRLRQIEAELTEEERAMVRRGRNASPQGPRTADASDYRWSTGFECLLGYLYWTGQLERLQALLERVSGQE